jgi:ethanolamine utilization protein EutN
MLICEVVGTVVSTAKADGFRGAKLLMVRERRQDGSLSGEVFVATDIIGAGTGELVLVAQGSAARVGLHGDQAPTDAAVVAIVDAVEEGNLTPGQKQKALQSAAN